ncbi:MAG: hypothetical protein M3Z75_25105 [Actinomycetota bacterium]|nr:hypothetical protein [Actinomycetota bacterium]
MAVAVAFTAAELAFVPRRMGLSWDEVVYASQVSAHGPASYFDSARARGTSLLVAPVTLVTSSFTALRVYMSCVAGAGLLAALWAWRRLRPGWQLALAGVLFGGLWVTQYYGPEVMPDLWSGLSVLAAVGCFLSFATGRGGRGALAGLATAVACAALFRPGDAMYLLAPLFVAVLAIKAWRRWELMAAALSGLVAGSAEWVIEANERFGGVRSRLHLAGIEQGGFGVHFALGAQWRALNGPTLCRPCTIAVTDPGPGLWWLALPLLVVAGVLAARVAGRLGSALLPAVCALCLAAQYFFMINYAAPRFLLPAYALLAMPVSDGFAWAMTGLRRELRPAAVAITVCLLAAQLVSQHMVLESEAAATVTYQDDYTTLADDLAALNVKPPCMLSGGPYLPVAYYMRCSSGWVAHPGSVRNLVLFASPGQQLPAFAAHWHAHHMNDLKEIDFIAYTP